MILEHFKQFDCFEGPNSLERVFGWFQSQLIGEYIRELPECNEHLRREGHFLLVFLVLAFELLDYVFQRDPLALYSFVQSEPAVFPRRQFRAFNLEVVKPDAV